MVILFEFWHWWALALILVVMEALSPSGIFLAMALAGTTVGAAFLLYPELDIKTQFGVFGVLSLLLYGIVSRFFGKSTARAQEVQRKAQAMVGKEFELTMPIRNNFGEIILDDEHWGLKGPDLPAGARVRVVGLDGDMLTVYPLSS